MDSVSENGGHPSENGTETSTREVGVADPLAALDLTQKQLTYLEHRFSGATVTDAADAAGVARTTPYKWRKEVDFRAARKLLDRARKTGFARRLHRLRDKALETVEKEVDEGNAELAIRVLTESGGLEQDANPLEPWTIEQARSKEKAGQKMRNLLVD